jgi:hypothetical protein
VFISSTVSVIIFTNWPLAAQAELFTNIGPIVSTTTATLEIKIENLNKAITTVIEIIPTEFPK